MVICRYIIVFEISPYILIAVVAMSTDSEQGRRMSKCAYNAQYRAPQRKKHKDPRATAKKCKTDADMQHPGNRGRPMIIHHYMDKVSYPNLARKRGRTKKSSNLPQHSQATRTAQKKQTETWKLPDNETLPM